MILDGNANSEYGANRFNADTVARTTSYAAERPESLGMWAPDLASVGWVSAARGRL
jgi:hypothetical protein